MLTALKLDALGASGELAAADWIVATTWPTSMSIGEIAGKAGLSAFRVPVGFKHFAALVRDLEGQVAAGKDPCRASDVTGATTEFGPRPRLLIMAEESGGAAMGPAEPMRSRHGAATSLAAKEKDAMQIGVMALCLGARLHRAGGSFAGYYLEQLARWETRYRFYERRDVTLFDESLQGAAREQAKAAGNARKEATVAFFADLVGRGPDEATRILVDALPEGTFLPTIERVFDAGDGTFIAFAGQWFELRASGTDAVLRYYMEGADADTVAELNEAFTRLDIPGTPQGRQA
jgi:phosphomannomutase